MKELINAAILISATIVVTSVMYRSMKERNFKVNAALIYSVAAFVSTLLYMIGGVSIWTVKGVILAEILLYASVQDISMHEADDWLSVMLLILALVELKGENILSMLAGGAVVFIPQMAIAVFTKGGIGGADIKISAAAALSLGFIGGTIGYVIGVGLAVLLRSMYCRIKNKPSSEAFALLPFLSVGLMVGYLIS